MRHLLALVAIAALVAAWRGAVHAQSADAGAADAEAPGDAGPPADAQSTLDAGPPDDGWNTTVPDDGEPPIDAGPGDDDSLDSLFAGRAHDDSGDEDYTSDDDDENAGGVTTGAVRGGIYADSDRTQVLRALAEATETWGHWLLGGSLGIDTITSASIDVRSSPGLSAVDVVTSASGRSSTSGGQMKDSRMQLTGKAGWNDGAGHELTLDAAAAAEADYESVRAGLNGSIDLFDRVLTLLGGVSATHNWIQSVLDRSLHRTMFNLGWSAGLALVLTPNDAVRLRYDGSLSQGYQASPYRNVRFGDWSTTTLANDQISFVNTIGSPDGLPEKEPEHRVSHAAELELVHALGDGIGLHPTLRLGRDSWGMRSLTASLDLRLARPVWRVQVGYRFYLQSRARFFQGKYTMEPSHYRYYTSDKELGGEVGHQVDLDVSRVLVQSRHPGDTRLLLDGHLTVMHYSYPDFLLLGSRTGAFLEIGVTWEL